MVSALDSESRGLGSSPLWWANVFLGYTVHLGEVLKEVSHDILSYFDGVQNLLLN